MSGPAPPGPRTARQWTADLSDPALPVVAELLAEGVPGPLEAVVAATGGEVAAAQLTQVTWWPGRSVTVTWDAVVDGGPLAGPGSFVATTVEAPPGAFVVGDGTTSVALWRVPHDPFLPALPPALQPGVAADVVRDLGGRVTGAGTVLRAYRPTRRAVVEVTGQGDRLFLKLVRPHRLVRLHEQHLRLADHLPVPRSLGLDTRLGLLVLEHLPGATLREALEDPAATLPDPAVVAQLPTAIPSVPGLAPVPSAVDTLPQVAGLLTALVPLEAGRVEDLVAEVGTDAVTDRVPVHGDYHEGQLLVADGRLVGVVDVDTAGQGRPGDDAATMLAHLSVWQGLSSVPDRVAAYATGLQRHWDAVLDPADLRLRVAARILALAAGPFRVQQADWPVETSRRIALAEQWVLSARRVRGG